MKIKFRQSGGFAGLVKSVEIDLDDLSGEEAEELKSLIEQADFFELPEPPRQTLPDMEQYSISIEAEGKTRKIHVGRSNRPDNLKPLIKHLAKKAKYEKR
jgi:hypothetical protein